MIRLPGLSFCYGFYRRAARRGFGLNINFMKKENSVNRLNRYTLSIHERTACCHQPIWQTRRQCERKQLNTPGASDEKILVDPCQRCGSGHAFGCHFHTRRRADRRSCRRPGQSANGCTGSQSKADKSQSQAQGQPCQSKSQGKNGTKSSLICKQKTPSARPQAAGTP